MCLGKNYDILNLSIYSKIILYIGEIRIPNRDDILDDEVEKPEKTDLDEDDLKLLDEIVAELDQDLAGTSVPDDDDIVDNEVENPEKTELDEKAIVDAEEKIEKDEELRRINNELGEQLDKFCEMIGDIYIKIGHYTREVEYDDLENLLKNKKILPEDFIVNQQQRFTEYLELENDIEELRQNLLSNLENLEKDLKDNKIDIEEANETRERYRRELSMKLKDWRKLSSNIFTGIISKDVFNIISRIIEDDKKELDRLEKEYIELNNQLETLQQQKAQLEGEQLEQIKAQEQDIKSRINDNEYDKEKIKWSSIKREGRWSDEHFFDRERTVKILVGSSFNRLLGDKFFFHMLFHNLFGAVHYVTPDENHMIDQIHRGLKRILQEYVEVSTLYEEALALKFVPNSLNDRINELRIRLDEEIIKNYNLDLIQITQAQWEILINEEGRYLLDDRWNVLVKMREEIKKVRTDIDFIIELIDIFEKIDKIKP